MDLTRIASPNFLWLKGEEMNIQLILVELLNHHQTSIVNSPEEHDEYGYTGIAIEDKGRFYYWAKGVSLEITQAEYAFIKANPKLYYFSTALKLHIRIEKLRLINE